MLASSGYPWTVIQVEDRNAFLSALDCASIDHEHRAFHGVHREVCSPINEANS
jgi:hypothetical protein